jgi:hypothetical protein
LWHGTQKDLTSFLWIQNFAQARVLTGFFWYESFDVRLEFWVNVNVVCCTKNSGFWCSNLKTWYRCLQKLRSQ